MITINPTKTDKETITLFSDDGKYGPTMSMGFYTEMAEAILTVLLELKEVPLNELIDKSCDRIARITGNKNWYFVKVKSDLEARGILKTNFKYPTRPSIRLVSRKFSKSDFSYLR